MKPLLVTTLRAALSQLPASECTRDAHGLSMQHVQV